MNNLNVKIANKDFESDDFKDTLDKLKEKK